MGISKPEYFFLIFFLTVLIVRVLLYIAVDIIHYIKPTEGLVIKGFRIHHYMVGIVLMPIGYLLINITIYAIGFGLFIDELTYILIKGKDHKDNYSIISLIGTAIFVILIYFLKEKLIFWAS